MKHFQMMLAMSGASQASDIRELRYDENKYFVEEYEEFTIIHYKIWAVVFDMEGKFDTIEPREDYA